MTKELRSIPAFEITQNRTEYLFQKQITNLYPVLLNYFVFYHLKFVSAKTLLVSRQRIFSFCPLFKFLYLLTRAF